jgi:hypothetical protein
MDRSQNIAHPDLSGWEPTRDTLSWYAKAVGSIPRVLLEAHPKWWHISLKINPRGLITDPIPRAQTEGETVSLLMDLKDQVLRILDPRGTGRTFSLSEGLPAIDFGEKLITELAEMGIEGAFDVSRFNNDKLRTYHEAHASAYLDAVTKIAEIQQSQKSEIRGKSGPVQLWPHHFDMAFEWYGTKQVTFVEQGYTQSYPSQINFGFSPGDESHPEPYFFSNPWPFHGSLISHPLPSGALAHRGLGRQPAELFHASRIQ